MTKPEIWKRIGDAYNTKFKDRTEEQKAMTCRGICRALCEFEPEHRKITYQMEKIIYADERIFGDSRPYFCKVREMNNSTDDPTELAEADAFRAKYCYEKMNEER